MRVALVLLGCLLAAVALWCGWVAGLGAAVGNIALEPSLVPAGESTAQASLSEPEVAQSRERLTIDSESQAQPPDSPGQEAPRLLDCLRLDEPEAIRGCLESTFDPCDLEPARLGRLLCGPASTGAARGLVVEFALTRWTAGELLDNAAATLAACSDRSIHDMLLRALASAADRDPALLCVLRDDLDEQQLFGPRASRLSIDLAAEFARHYGDPGLRALLEAGACGEFGGQQIDRALLRAAALQESANAKLDFLSRVEASSQLPHDYQCVEVGASIAMLLLQPGMLDGALSLESWRLLQDTLAHRLLGDGCALQITGHGTRDTPPSGVGSLEWRRLWDSALARIEGARASGR